MNTAPTIPDSALALAREWGAEAAKTDNWLEFNADVGKSVNCADFDEFQTAHRSEWEGTNHFEYFYDRRLTEMSINEAAAQGVEKPNPVDTNAGVGVYSGWQAWHEDFYRRAVDAFWDAWEEKIGFHERWKAVYGK